MTAWVQYVHLGGTVQKPLADGASRVHKRGSCLD